MEKMKIGNQEFERVGEKKAEKVDLRRAPKSFGLYQDTESGALMGELPENHFVLTREDKERQERLEDFDLTQLTPLEACSLLTGLKNEKSGGKENKDIKIYGRINNGDEKELLVFDRSGIYGSHQYFVFYKGDAEDVGMHFDWEAIRELHDSMHIINSDRKTTPAVKKYSNVEITPENIKITGKNSLLIGGKEGNGSAEISFLEVPKEYNELMKKKAGKAE